MTWKRALERIGYEVLVADNGQRALEVFQQHRDAIDVVILDLIMPVMGGADALVEFRKLYPDLKILVSSGYAEEDDQNAMMKSPGVTGWIRKPCTLEELERALLRALGRNG